MPPAAGFTHSAFTFAHESLVARSVVADADVPPGALISFMQKGLQYVEIESHLQEDGSERQCDEPFFLLAPHVCRVKSLYSAGGKGRGGGELSSGWEGSGAANGGGGSIEVPPSDVTLLVGHKREVFVAAFHPTADILATGSGDGTARLWRLDAAAGGGDPPCTVLQHSTTGGDGRKGGGAGGKDKTQDVAALDWSPDGSRLATGMYDGRARIWSLDGALQSVLTGHTSAVFSIQWSPAGQFVLTGSGEGDLTSHRNNSHVPTRAPLLQLLRRLCVLHALLTTHCTHTHSHTTLCTAADKSAIVWDATTGLPAQQFSHHTGPVLDVDWASETTFATASSDKTVSVCTLGAGGGGNSNSNSGNGSPLRSFVGHTDEVNAIQWNPAKSILASASDDGTARLWSLSSSSSGSGGSGTGGDGCVGVLAGHKKAVYSAKWAPTGEGSRNPGKAPLLAT